MATSQLAKRVSALEAELAQLKEQLTPRPKPKVAWWHKLAGRFAGDQIYAEAMRLGREYRESLRPPAKKEKRQNGRT
jgi:hypothetical protein